MDDAPDLEVQGSVSILPIASSTFIDLDLAWVGGKVLSTIVRSLSGESSLSALSEASFGDPCDDASSDPEHAAAVAWLLGGAGSASASASAPSAPSVELPCVTASDEDSPRAAFLEWLCPVDPTLRAADLAPLAPPAPPPGAPRASAKRPGAGTGCGSGKRRK